MLLFLIGSNIGYDGTVIENFKKVGLRIHDLSGCDHTGLTWRYGSLSPILGISVREALAVW